MAPFMPNYQGMTFASAYQESQAVLMGMWPTNQRSSPRELIVCPIAIEVAEGTVHGIVRDISAEGIFFYSHFKPVLHMNVAFVVQVKGKNIRGTGKIIRIQEAAPGAAIGIAVKVSGWDDRAPR
jgi:hypothetical protein